MSKMKKVLIALVALVTVVVAGVTIAATAVTTGKTVEVTTPQKMTSAALGKGTVIGTIAKGTTATVVKISGAYSQVKLYNSGLTGWVKTSGLKVTTLQPQSITNISKISTEWLASEHGQMPNAAYAGSRGAGCAPCHSGNGLEKYADATPFTPNINTTDSTGYKFDPKTVQLPTQIGCATCHQGYGASILVSGKVPAKLNVYSGGTTELSVGNGNALCITCHNGRRNVKAIYESWTVAGKTKLNDYPHHAWGSLVSGQGGMEYPGVTYAKSSTHMTQGCIGCHMTKKAGYTSHTFKPELATCQQCHKGAKDFELTGTAYAKKLENELNAKLAELKTLVLAKVPNGADIGYTRETFPAVDAAGVQIKADKITSAEALVGAYNYAVVKMEMDKGAKGAHNPRYAKSLLDVSIQKLKEAK